MHDSLITAPNAPIFLCITLLLSILSYGFFVILSMALLRARRPNLERAKEEGKWGGSLSLYLVKNADRYFITAQIGKFLSVCLIGANALLLFLVLLNTGNLLALIESPVILFFFCLVLVIFFVSTITLGIVQFSKALGFHYAENVLLLFGWSFFIFDKLFTPFRFLSLVLSGILLRIVGLERPDERELHFSSEDLEEVIEQSAQAGTIDISESELLQGALKLSEIRVREIMTPRVDIASVNIDSQLQDLPSAFVTAGFSRLLVVGEQLDEIKGIVLLKDLIPYINSRKLEGTILDVMREVVSVSGELNADEVLRIFRAHQAHFGVVLDEHGGVDGIVTLEDLLEEIVGEIFDETDNIEDEQEAIRTHTGALIVDAGMSLSDLHDDHQITIPEGEYDTVAGFVIDQLGHIPEQGEQVHHSGYRFVIESVEENRVLLIQISQDSYEAFESLRE